MDSVFFRLGQVVGARLRKGKWLWQSLTGSERDIIEAEQAVGRDLAAEFRREMGLDPDPQGRQLVTEVGTRLSKCVRNKWRRFDFALVIAGQANAFALPGGFVFITRPLLDLVQHNRDEVAFILGHEMAHVINQDPGQRIVGNTAIAATIRALPAAGLTGQWLKSSAARLLQGAYSQDRELLADKLGARLPQAAGFDPHAAIRMLHRLEEAKKALNSQPLCAYFSTHPAFDRRLEGLNQLLRSE